MVSIAAVVGDISTSQNSFFMIKEFNKLIEDVRFSTSVFFQRPSVPPVKPFFACRGVTYLSSYHGVAIATGMQEAQVLLNSGNASDKYLYVWDLEWIDNPMMFDQAMKIMRDKRLKIIARSESHAVAIDNFCNKKPIGIVSDWNAEQLIRLVKNENDR